MRILWTGILALLLLWSFVSCQKDEFIYSPDAKLNLSVDTLRFDTVFTSTGSVTYSFLIRNQDEQKIRLDRVILAGREDSDYRINVNGEVGPVVNDIIIEGNDSAYVFVKVNIDPSNADAPFLVRDSIRVEYNQTHQQVQLEAYGQNAYYLRNKTISSDTTFASNKPIVIYGGLQVSAGKVLTLQAGTKMYFHADAPLLVDGTLRAEGTLDQNIFLRGDRLDDDYKDLPASWPGIIFSNSSSGNLLTYTHILNAYRGIEMFRNTPPTQPQVTLRECIIDNCYEEGILCESSSLEALNCRITNCGMNILIIKGGTHLLEHCTIAAYSNIYVSHLNPLLVATNWDSTGGQLQTHPFQFILRNSICWADGGNEDEIVISRKGISSFAAAITYSLVKWKNAPPDVTIGNLILNEDPRFDSIQVATRYYDWRINKGVSPVIDKGVNSSLQYDLAGTLRDSRPDLGCYEKK